MKEYFERQRKFGTIPVLTGTEMDAEEMYNLLKSRMDIEQLFDTFKSTLHADGTYMRDNNHMQGWMFVNFMAMLMYHRLCTELVSKKLLRKYSPHDIIIHLSRIEKLGIDGQWALSEIPKT